MSYINYQYIETAEKITVRRMLFFYCNGKLGLMLKKTDVVFICENMAFSCNNCNCFSIFFSYFVKV